MWRLILFTCVAFILTLSSCRTTNLPIETIKIDTIYKSINSIDTFIERDTFSIIYKNDTVYKEKIKYVYKYQLKTDTLREIKADTIVIEKEIEKQLSKKDNFYLFIGEWVCWLLIIFLCGFLAYKYFKKE